MPRSTRKARPSFRLVVTVAALAATVPIAGARAETLPNRPCNVKGASGQAGKSWQTFKAPTFLAPQGLGAATQEIEAYAVAPSNPDLVAVTNGNSIQVSTDSGCRWKQLLRLDQVPQSTTIPLSGQFTKIRGLYFAPRTNRLFALAEELDTGATVGRPHVLINDDAAHSNSATWRLGDSGLPPVGKPLTMEAHPKSPNVVYLSFANAKAPEGGAVQCPPAPLPCPGAEDNGTPGLLWGSIDGGQTWTRRTDPGDVNGASVIRYFSIEDDDATGKTLWVVSNGQLRKSENSGASFSTPDGLDQSSFNFSAVESIDSPQDHANPVKVLAFSTGGEMIRLEGGRWIRSRVPFSSVESVSQRKDGDIVVATTPSAGGVTVWRIYGYQFRDYEFGDSDNPLRFKVTFGWQSITPQGVTVAARVSSSNGKGTSTYFLRDRKRILRFLGTRITDDISVAPPAIGGTPPPPVGNIQPDNYVANIPLGKTETVDYTLTLPPAPTPIDLYLLIDNSGSMQPLIDELKRSLGDVANSLVRSRVDVHIGVGQINVQPDRQELPIDDPNTDWDESKPRPVYQRLRPVAPVRADLFEQLSKIDGRGGSGDEAQLEALWQSAVGDGYEPLGLGAVTGYNVPRGEDARWREGEDTVRVIVHATDEKFSDNIRGGHNSIPEVADALRNLGIKQIGLSQGVDDAHADLSEMARRTGALAPPGGTDCDGNGRVDGRDPRGGEPLVCEQNFGLDKTLVNLIKALQDPQDLSLQVSKGPTVRAVSQTTFRINAKNASKVGFQVTFSCVGVAPGQYVHTIKAGLRGIQVDQTAATVNCGGGPPPPPPGNDPGLPPQQPPPIQPQPLPAPIAPVQPIPQPQTQVNAQSQVNPQTGAARQKQHQLQVALAENDIGPQDEDQLAMVGLSNERAVAPATGVVIAGMALASACGAAFAFRRRSQVARAYR